MRRTPITPTMRRVLAEMADGAAYSKRMITQGPARDVDFNRTRYVVLENTIANCLFVALRWDMNDARKHSEELVSQRVQAQDMLYAATKSVTTLEQPNHGL